MFSIRVEGLDAIGRKLDGLAKQVRYAAARAINDTALQDVRPALQAGMDAAFDRPTPWIKRSVWVDQAKPEQLVARVYPRYSGGKSVDPAKVLRAEVQGGSRNMKRAEIAFQRIGILPAGWFMVPGAGAPLDAYGNLRGSFIVQLLAYFNAFGEQGYRANMTDKRRAALAKVKRTKAGFQRIGGVQYFVSHGKGTRGALPSEGRQGREQRLPAGIWSRTGIHGSDIKPILIFVRGARYPVRYRMGDIVTRAVHTNLPRRFAAWLDRALATAK